jgi:hypothetical protein
MTLSEEISFFTIYQNTKEKNIFVFFAKELYVSQSQLLKLFEVSLKKLQASLDDLTPYIFNSEFYYHSEDVIRLANILCAFEELKQFKVFLEDFDQKAVLSKILKSDSYETSTKIYCLKKDGHGKKHTSLTYEQAMKPKSAATFNSEFKKKYDTTLKVVIISLANVDRDEKSINIVDFKKEVGIDEQSKTTCIELYYEDEGSHIRPKKTANQPCIFLNEVPVMDEQKSFTP